MYYTVKHVESMKYMNKKRKYSIALSAPTILQYRDNTLNSLMLIFQIFIELFLYLFWDQPSHLILRDMMAFISGISQNLSSIVPSWLTEIKWP